MSSLLDAREADSEKEQKKSSLRRPWRRMGEYRYTSTHY